MSWMARSCAASSRTSTPRNPRATPAWRCTTQDGVGDGEIISCPRCNRSRPARCATSASRSRRWSPSPSRSRAMPPIWSMVDYEELPAVIDPYEAIKDGAPQLYAKVKNNISVREASVHGDVEARHGQRRDQGESQDPRAALPSGADGRTRRAGDARSDHARHHLLELDPGAALEPQLDRRCARLEPEPGALHRAGGRRRFRLQDRRVSARTSSSRPWRSSTSGR